MATVVLILSALGALAWFALWAWFALLIVSIAGSLIYRLLWRWPIDAAKAIWACCVPPS